MKKTMIYLSILGIICGSLLMANETNIPAPYRFIEDLPFDDHGWFFNAVPLEEMFQKKQPKTVIEVGSWLGSSARFMASKLPENGMLYAVDTWKGTLSEAETQKDSRIPMLYQIFLSNVKHAKLTHKITPIRMESLEAAKATNIKADLIYIDGAHDTTSVYNDILAWYPHLLDGGVMTGDDWHSDAVKAGVILAAKKLNKKVNSQSNTFWWYE